jgi:hypothetical protein
VQLETGVMPWASNGVIEDYTLIQRRAVMRALGADGKPVGLAAYQEHRLSKGVTGDELTGANTADLDARSQIGSGQLIVV